MNNQLIIFLSLIYLITCENITLLNNSYACPEYDLSYNDNILEFLSPLFSESMKYNITKLADQLWNDLILNTNSKVDTNLIKYFKKQQNYFNLDDKVYESELMKISIKLGISISKILLLNQLPLLSVFTDSLYQGFQINNKFILSGNLESENYQNLLTGVAVKINVFDSNSKLLYKGLMFAGTIGIYAGILENQYTIVYGVERNQIANNFLNSIYQSDPAYNLRKLFDNQFNFSEALQYLLTTNLQSNVAFIVNAIDDFQNIVITSQVAKRIENLQIISDYPERITSLDTENNLANSDEIYQRMISYPYRNTSTILTLVMSISDNLFNITIWDNYVEEIIEEDKGPSLLIVILLVCIFLIFAIGVTAGVINFKAYQKKLDQEHKLSTYDEINKITNLEEILENDHLIQLQI